MAVFLESFKVELVESIDIEWRFGAGLLAPAVPGEEASSLPLKITILTW
jgi:hypothetical protein